jgi:hypothetical protein
MGFLLPISLRSNGFLAQGIFGGFLAQGIFGTYPKMAVIPCNTSIK